MHYISKEHTTDYDQATGIISQSSYYYDDDTGADYNIYIFTPTCTPFSYPEDIPEHLVEKLKKISWRSLLEKSLLKEEY